MGQNARPSGRRQLLRTVLMASATVGAALPASHALAQDAAPAAEAPTDIVVTAQRRAERVQGIPLSVTALSGEALRNANVTSVDRLEQVIPGVRIGRSGTDIRPAIRGTYTENTAANGDPRIGIYMDDVYQSRTSQVPPIVDLERVEAQKGPQGTLYGRNSFGGNIAFFSATPKDTLSAGIEGTYGSYDRRRLEGFLNVPITAGVAARVAGMYEKSDGYIKNVGTGNDVGDEDQWFVRGSLRIAPEALDDRLEILLRGSYYKQGGAGQYSFGYKFLGTLVDPSLIRAPGESLTYNGTTYTFPNGFNGNSFTGQAYAIDTRYRDGVADVNGADIGIATLADPYKIDTDADISRRTRQQQYSGTISFDAGFVKLRSITSYANFSVRRSGDDITPAPLYLAWAETKAKTFTQELQVLSNDTSSPLQWIVGGYYFDDDVTEASVTNYNRSYSTAAALAAGQLALYNWSFNYFPTAANAINQATYSDSFGGVRQKTRSYAGYGQVSYTIADKLTLTGGYRYTSDRKTLMANTSNASPTGGTGTSYFVYDINDPVNFACGETTGASSKSNATNYAVAQRFLCASQTFNFSTFRLAADYKFSRDHMIYASYSTGRHSGGFNTGPVTINGTPTLIPFAPEKVTAYEIGSKNSFLNGQLTLNVTGFWNDYTDLQAQTSIPNPNAPTTGVIALVQNIGKDRAYGIDVEAVARPDRHLTINIGFNWMHARELEYAVNTFDYGFCGITANNCANAAPGRNTVQGTPFPNVVTDPNRFIPVLDSNGNQVVTNGVAQYRYVIAGTGADGTKYKSRKAFSPDYTVQIGAAYAIDLGQAGTLTPEVQTYFNSGYILTDLTPNFGNQKAYTKTDLRLTYVTADEKIRAQIFVNNLEDKAVLNRVAYSSNRELLGNYGMPRTWGMSLGYRF